MVKVIGKILKRIAHEIVILMGISASFNLSTPPPLGREEDFFS